MDLAIWIFELFNPSEAGWYLIYLLWRDGQAELTCVRFTLLESTVLSYLQVDQHSHI